MTPDPRYPLGRFSDPGPATPEQRRAWIMGIAQLPADLRAAVAGLGDARLDVPYRDGGWTVRQVVHHLADSHAVASLRFRLMLIQDEPPFQPYDEGRLAALPDAARGPLEPSLALLEGLHARWAHLLREMEEPDFQRAFLHPERGRVSLEHQLARSCWHGRHHTAQILALKRHEGW